MSHVDDGTLHSYLDGELSSVEVERLETHLAGCAGCRSRLEEERVLIERAARLLGAAAPPGPARTAPPLHQLARRRSAWGRLRVPLAWAATIVLALGLGWYGRSLQTSRVSVDSATTTPTQSKVLSAPADAGRLGRASDAEPAARPPVSAAVAGALADRQAREEADELRPSAKAAEQLATGQAQPASRDAAAPAPVASNGIVTTPAAPAVPTRKVAGPLSTSWPVIEPQPAKDLLGVAPVTIPGYAVRAVRRNPSEEREIVVEQEIANGVVVSLFEQPIGEQLQMRRFEAARARADERLARFVGGLRIEISGPLPMDSLSRLLELISP